jgi:hypothetical protein
MQSAVRLLPSPGFASRMPIIGHLYPSSRPEREARSGGT